MRKLTMSALLASALAIGGCTAYGSGYGYGDGYGYNDGYGDRYGNYGGDYGYSYSSDYEFERAAVNACGREASRYGRIQITYADERQRGVYTVQGQIEIRDPSRDQFTCEFSSSGRIVDFKLG